MRNRTGTSPERLSRPRRRQLAAGLVIICFAVLGAALTPGGGDPETREVVIRARQYGFEPHRLVVNQGDELRIRFAAEDVVHGIFIEGYDSDSVVFPGRLEFHTRHPSHETEFRPVEEIGLVADKWGKFRYRWSVTCGALHPFLQGELVVRPNYPLWVGLASIPGVFLAGLFLVFGGKDENRSGPASAWRIDLLRRLPVLDWLVRRPWL